MRRIFFTEVNTGLDKPSSEYPALARCWKAAHVKVILWYMAKKAVEFAELSGVAQLCLVA